MCNVTNRKLECQIVRTYHFQFSQFVLKLKYHFPEACKLYFTSYLHIQYSAFSDTLKIKSLHAFSVPYFVHKYLVYTIILLMGLYRTIQHLTEKIP
jgi:hypothetical protein